MNLSKTKYCNAVQCNKMLWLNINKPEEAEEVKNSSILDNGTEVGIVAKDLFGFHFDVSYNDNLSIMISDTEKLLHLDKVVITEASFKYNNNFCSVDILKKDKDNFEIYEVKSSTEVKDIFIDDISYQVYVLTKLGYNITKACIVYINNKYEYKDKLELDKLFNIEDVTDRLRKIEEIENKIKEINNYMEQKSEPEEFLGMHCVKPYDCPFFKYCTKDLDEYNVFNIRLMHNDQKFKLYNKGIFEYKDLLKEDLNPKYIEQMEFELYNKEPYINKEKIKEFLDTLYYPLYFLDFETFQMPIPKYNKINPYNQIPFQYSLHYIEKENGELEHKEFLAEPDIDPRRKLAESLVKDIPKDVCVLVYNMGFEKPAIKKLASLYPDLSDHLMNIHDNIKDLIIPFRNRDYYIKEMYGSYSIKYVLPALFPDDPSLNYHNLELIHHGGEAMSAYAEMGKLDEEEQKKLREALLKYCELDTFAMVKIYEKLKELVN